MAERLIIPFPVIVEGAYDKMRLQNVIEAQILTTDGFGVFNKNEKTKIFRALASRTPLIVLTDSDGAGKLIRAHLSSILPADRLIHLYVPRIAGKEKRKAAPGKEGKLGVEGMTPEVILEALRRAGATFENSVVTDKKEITKQDLMKLGLSGGKNSSLLRKELLQKLGLPEHMSANAMLQALNLLCTKEELYECMKND